MNKLPPEAASLLEQARSHDRAHQVDMERSLAALHASLPFAASDLAELADPLLQSAGEVGSETLGGALSSLGKGALFTGKSIKVFLATVALGGAIGGTAWLESKSAPEARGPRPASSQRAATSSGSARSETEPARESARAADDSAAPQGTTTRAAATLGKSQRAADVSPLARPPLARREAARRTEGVSPVAKSSTRKASSSDGAEPQPELTTVAPVTETKEVVAATPAPGPSELDLIDGALTSLRKGDGHGALTQLALHQRLHAHGKFATERSGLRVLGLCALGRVEEAERERDAFLAAHPNAPIAARVRRACALAEGR
jgi:hypothetical protein